MPRDLTDKLIVITGASSGIGAATALACAKAGMDVAVSARRTDKLKQVADEITSLGRRSLVVECDVTVDADVQGLMRQAQEAFGRVDAVFANAGYGIFGTVLDTDLQTHRDIFETNYYGTLRTIREAVPYLQKTGDGLKHLLICSSVASEIGVPKFGAYCATKAAQDSVAGAMRGELADEGIVVTSVHPMGTSTEFGEQARALSPDRRAAERGSTPSSLMQTKEHVAAGVVKTLRRPRPELWPSTLMRFTVALGTVSPRFAAWAMRRYMRKVSKD